MWHRPMMTKDDGQRMATSDGAMLADRAMLVDGPMLTRLFDPVYWSGRGALVPVTGGRGSAWFIGETECWVLRHYRRGGFIARLSKDIYLWNGEARVRAFAEWRLLAELSRRGLPVPKPIAARYQRTGLVYRCDLVTLRIPNARPLSALLSHAPMEESTWRTIGSTIARLHAAGADHADLNAHNILLGTAGTIGGGNVARDAVAVAVIDFDRGRLRMPGAWVAGNLSRLKHSLLKIARVLPPDRFCVADWDRLMVGYGSIARHAPTV